MFELLYFIPLIFVGIASFLVILSGEGIGGTLLLILAIIPVVNLITALWLVDAAFFVDVE